jgi:hypothetical protein
MRSITAQPAVFVVSDPAFSPYALRNAATRSTPKSFCGKYAEFCPIAVKSHTEPGLAAETFVGNAETAVGAGDCSSVHAARSATPPAAMKSLKERGDMKDSKEVITGLTGED